MDFQDISLLIIAGGRSMRMGQDKRWLEIDGRGMLERLCIKAARQPFAARYLCVGRVTPELQQLAAQYGCELVMDAVSAQGPLAGLAQGLARLKTAYALAVAGDMPFMTFPELKPLLQQAAEHPAWQAIVPVVQGCWQPLAALYQRALVEPCTRALAQGERRLRTVLAQVPHGTVDFPSRIPFFNVNTPADFRLACGRMQNLLRELPLVTIAAPQSNTGKTTFIEGLLPRLAAHGWRVGVVKGDCHGYDVDERGKDSWRFREAGAQAVAVVSPEGYFVQQRTRERASLTGVAALLQNVDLVLIESRAHGTAPQLMLWRGAGELTLTPDTAAVFAQPQPAHVSEQQIHLYDLNDLETATELVLFLAGHR